jgi:hypothetical protein
MSTAPRLRSSCGETAPDQGLQSVLGLLPSGTMTDPVTIGATNVALASLGTVVKMVAVADHSFSPFKA